VKNILVPIDFSVEKDAVVNSAAEIAKAFSAKLWLIHVAAPDPEFVGYGIGPKHERDWRAATLREEHRYIQERSKTLEAEGVNIMPLLIQGPTIETILDEAQRINADMVVIGRHSQGSFSRLLMGSVSKGVLKGATCPVLIVKQSYDNDS